MSSCFALLDDNNDAGATPTGRRSRLYTRYQASLVCHEAAQFPQLLSDLQAALQKGWHAVTLFSYELGAALEQIAAHAGHPALAEILLFAECRHLDGAETKAWLQAQERAEAPSPAGIANVRANIDETQFMAHIARIHDYIAAGDTYQVNYTYRLHFDTYGAPVALYNRLRLRQPVPYGALIGLPDDRYVLSFSPELFVRHRQGMLQAQPMKGTASATDAAQENHRRAADLAGDEKNRAENLMIVDLLRNDLGRVAEAGSVAVPHLFAVEQFGKLLQMTSTITAQLRPDVGLAELLSALFPCGSITGAPKRRAMQIIRELEPAPRRLYSGALGWFDAPPPGRAIGDFCLSVPIRTLLLQARQAGAPPGWRSGEMGVGAGIVHDSRAADEYAECRLKADFLTGLDDGFALFETLYATRDNGCRHLDLHLRRLQRSARYFNFVFDEATIRAELAQACAQLPAAAPCRVRLTLRQDGHVDLQSGALAALPHTVKVFIADRATRKDNVFLHHKSTVRADYDCAWQTAERHGGFDMLFFNQDDELTEGGRSNVFVHLDGRWYTPPLAAGVLPGVMRSVLLDDPVWSAAERRMTRNDLRRARSVILCNALRGAVTAEVVWDMDSASVRHASLADH